MNGLPRSSNSGGVPPECKLAPLCKVCVFMFLFLSGFGVSSVLERNRNRKNPWRISLRFVWKLLFGFWVIYLLFVPWQPLFGHQPYTSWFDMLKDLIGAQYLCGYGWLNTNTMNKTWWYLSLAILCYIFTPIFDWLLKKSKWLTALGMSAVLLGTSVFIIPKDINYLIIYIIGMMFQKYRLFDFFECYLEKSSFLLVSVISFGFVAVTALAEFWKGDFAVFVPMAMSLIIFSFLCLSRIKYLSTALAFIGKHSANIFLFHTFIYSYDFQKIIYAPKLSVLVYLFLLVVCLGISMLIEKIKEWTHLNRLEKFISAKIEGKPKEKTTVLV